MEPKPTTEQAEQPGPPVADAPRARGRSRRRDGGFSLIEIMAGMAIIAILALAILPQFSKYFERAAVQNLSQEVMQAAQTVESDYSLTGKALYLSDNVEASLLSVKRNPATHWDGSTMLQANGLSAGYWVNQTGVSSAGFLIQGDNPAVTDYNVWYCSTGPQPGLRVQPSSVSPTCS